ncbi:heavy metal translocating P-type ATPase [Agrilutibacter solisilvae]|uniref:Heavy metal translocating P-type ATPase n=1 Tax=Agrilutibacter solisilvae TaxID=2763317 RepID=A0A975AS63_9GAMM|nr:heavy metal translocating P-type ATPase [Lysobacter solisilvae]QSX77650.1 heavy metal translocating P-type ATPase [Lysobacter solisilvae]
MAVVAEFLQVEPAPATRGGCYHCGEALPPSPARLQMDGVEQAFCCDGCAAAAHWIRDAHLQDYYRLRSAPAGRVAPDAAALAAADLTLWDREEVLAEHARNIRGGRELTLLTDGMRCAACAWLVDRALTREPGVLEVTANAVTGRVRIAWDPAVTPLSRPLARLAALGYRPWLATGEARERARRDERGRWLLRLGVAGLGAMQAMMFAEASYLDTTGSMSMPMRDFLRWVTFLVATPVVFYAGWPFLAGCWREVRHRRLGMDTLIATSTLLAYGASVVETVRGGAHVWFDAAVMFVFLLLAARMLEQRVRSRASAQVDALARARPAFATRENADGDSEMVPVSALRTGEITRVAAGEAVPADGDLLSDEASFEESLLTGEPLPVRKRAGAPVFAGSVCREQAARIRITATGGGTRLSQLASLVERAQEHRPAVARKADRIAAAFVVALLLATAPVYLAWLQYQPARAFEVALALLVISCPCALSLSVPAALAAAHGALARIGVLPVQAQALERLAAATDVVFDKTGTLSDGSPSLGEVETFDGFDRVRAIRIAAALERDSGHALAAAFTQACRSTLSSHSAPWSKALTAAGVVAVAGRGIEGIVEGRRWRLGTSAFAGGGDDDGAIWLAEGSRRVARFLITERERADAAQAIGQLRAQGLALHLCSGDAATAVARFAAALGLDSAHSRQTPEAKLDQVRGLQHAGRVVAMVGDGLNDAPVLAGADVSFAIGEGAPLAHQAADFVLSVPALARIPAAIDLARRTRRIIRQNFAWAIAYNVVALPLAAMGLVTPWLAALGMALSSLTVTLNALRLSRGGPA